MDSNGDGVGDLPGIISQAGLSTVAGHRCYLDVADLPSPMADFGYDVSEYTGIHPVSARWPTSTHWWQKRIVAA